MAIHAQLAAFGVCSASAAEIAPAQAFAARLIGPGIASATTLRRVHEQSGAGVFLAHEEGVLTGVLAFVLLNKVGYEAITANAFDGVDPAPAHVARSGQKSAALYGWGIAASTHSTAKRLIGGLNAIARSAVPDIPYFSRPATPAGERLLIELLKFKPCNGGLVWLEPYSVRVPVAA